MLYLGIGVPQNPGEAERWFRKAAEQEIEDSVGRLRTGIYFYTPCMREKPRTEEEIVKLLQRDAKPQSGTDVFTDYAQEMLAVRYFVGRGVAQDDTTAAELLSIAAEQDNNRARDWLARSFMIGVGQKKNYVEAYYWFERAESTYERNALASQMSADQLAEAQAKTRNIVWN